MKRLYDIRWHNEKSHLLGTMVMGDLAQARAFMEETWKRPQVRKIVVWVGSGIEVEWSKKGDLT